MTAELYEDEISQHRSKISIIEMRIVELTRLQSLMHVDLKKSLDSFVLVMRVLTIALMVELGIQAALMSVLILRDSPKELRANKEGFSITEPHP